MADTGERSVSEAAALVRALDANEDFRRDTALGRIFHPGAISFREVAPNDSLHIIVSGTRVSAHIDDISPLNCDPSGSHHYRWSRVLAHNASGVVVDLARRLTGRYGDHRCNLECDVVEVGDIRGDATSPRDD